MRIPISIVAILILSLSFSCSRPPYYQTNKMYKTQVKKIASDLQTPPPLASTANATPAYWVGTTNFNMRKPNFVILHHTAQKSCDETLKTFTMQKTQVSAHYVICKDGTVHHMLNDYLRAWHGGAGKWGSVTDINSSSIGIELDNTGTEFFADEQINSLLTLLDTLKRKYNIPTANFIAHGDIAPGRKVDPSAYFPWYKLAKRGFGIWYDDELPEAPQNFDYLMALKVIGYDVKDSTSAILAFKRKFVGAERMPPTLNETEKKMVFNILKKVM
jgi:N-acetylmuramoyl-L-alanine amidase